LSFVEGIIKNFLFYLTASIIQKFGLHVRNILLEMWRLNQIFFAWVQRGQKELPVQRFLGQIDVFQK
jgi:hypothetical protein